ncbi:MAG: cation-transporting P-type ATPase [Alphaproteobacteria bacterium]
MESRPSLSVIHAAVPGRARFRHALVARRADVPPRIARALAACPGVRSYTIDRLTGSVLVRFDPPASLDRLAAAIEAAAAPETRAHMPAVPAAAPPEPAFAAHSLPVATVLRALRTPPDRGLAAAEAAARLNLHGPNILPRHERRSIAAMLLGQAATLPSALLGGSAALSLLTGGLADAVVIAGVVALNAVIATASEARAERIIAGLLDEAPLPVAVIRDGRRQLVDPADLAPGDVIVLEPGGTVPADARLIATDQLTLSESALTGEAMPVQKDWSVRLPDDTALADRFNMAFRGTTVTGGFGRAVVVATGRETEIGKVHHLLGTVRPPQTEIERELGGIEKELIAVNGVICGGMVLLGLMRGQPLVPLIRSAISLAVAAIPEGLPAVATTTLALGVEAMKKRNVLVRRLDAVESLGAIDVLSLDKTGTLTENRMQITAALAGVEAVAFRDGRPSREADGLRPLLEAMALCSEAGLAPDGDRAAISGSPTEAALVQAALDCGLDVAALRAARPQTDILRRAEGRKRMATLHAGAEPSVMVKGDPEEVLALCRRIHAPGGPRPLTAADRAAILKANARMAGAALRVLGAAHKPGGRLDDGEGFVWLGLAGLANPIRPSVRPALRQFHAAGIRTVMITGDQSATALAIARQLDLSGDDELRALDAGQVSGLPPDLLQGLVRDLHVFARVNPSEKLNIVRALQAGGHMVAMTGDGINDGPALRAADVGVAMGAGGTDVARNVADIVLATDDLGGIIDALRLGRATYDNIRKVLRYLVATNASETMTMFSAALFGQAEPLTPLQLLWLNLVTDVFPAIALGLEPPETDVLDRPPHDPKAHIMQVRDFRRVLAEGAVISLAAFAGGKAGTPGSPAAFHSLTIAQLVHAFASRSELHGLAELKSRPAGPWLYRSVALSAALQAGAQFLPPLRRMLNLAPMGGRDLAAAALSAGGAAIANEALGMVWRRGPGGRGPA